MGNEMLFGINLNINLTKSKIAEILISKGFKVNNEKTFVLIESDEEVEHIEIVKFFNEYANNKILNFIIEQ